MKKNDKQASSKEAIQPEKVKFTNKQLGFEVLLFLFVLMAIYLLISLVSFDPADPGWSQTAWHEPIHNLGGIIGAYISDILLQFVGFIAFCVPCLIILFSVQGMSQIYYYRNKSINFFSLSLRTIGALAFVFSSTGFFALNIADAAQFQAGGILGDIVIGEMLPFFNHIGSSIILFAISFVCITLLTGLSWFFIAEMVGLAVVIITKPIFSFIAYLFRKRDVDDSQSEQAEQLDELEYHSEPVLEPILEEQVDQQIEQEAEFVNDSDSSEPVLGANSIFLSDDDAEQDESTPSLPQVEFCHVDEPIYEAKVIDENNPPAMPVIPDYLAPKIDGLSINPDYYSPLANQNIAAETLVELAASTQEESSLVELNDEPIHHSFEPELPVEFKQESEPEPESELAQIDVAHSLTKENIHDSLIHPLLRKDDLPIKKPTTPLPSLNLLTSPPVKQIEVDHNALKAMAKLIEQSLADFRVKAKVVDYLPGPVITRFEIELAPGVKASRISTLDRDLARSLSMPSVRVVEVIPGKPYVGIELPNKHRQTVYFKEVLDSPQFTQAKSPLTVVLGKDIAGQSVVADLAKMPHLLVAGTTGSGKSVGVNAMILSVLYKSQPEDVRFIMIDPKMLELSVYEGIPHLLTDVVTDMKDAANALNWCVNEMERRYRLMSALGVRNIAGYNEKIKLAEDMGRPIPDPLWRPTDSMDIDMPTLVKLPYIVVMVDEFADLIMAVGKKVEELIARLAQKARAAGIHLVLATQRPSVDVITGLIKANIPTRVAFTVSSKIDSRTILDQMGAESLLGMGDMLYLAPNSSIPIRVHGAFVRDEEVHSVVQDWKARGIPTDYIDNITSSAEDSDSNGFSSGDEDLDPLFDQVVSFVVEKRRASISGVQRQFRIGYNRAARIVEQMEEQGIVSPPAHNGNREVLAQSTAIDY